MKVLQVWVRLLLWLFWWVLNNSSQATFDCVTKWIILFLSFSLSLLVQINGLSCFYHYHCDCWSLFSFTSNANRFPCYKTSKSQNSHQTNKKVSSTIFFPFITVATCKVNNWRWTCSCSNHQKPGFLVWCNL